MDGSFVEGQGANIKTIGSQKSAGTSLNEISYSFDEGTNPNNYSISTTAGTLNVNKRDITMYSKSAYANEGPVSAPGVYKDSDCEQEFDDSVFLADIVEGSLQATGVANDASQGAIINSITYTFLQEELANNYNVVMHEGILQVVEEGQIPIAYYSYNGLYDGQYHGSEAIIPDGAEFDSVTYYYYYASEGQSTKEKPL